MGAPDERLPTWKGEAERMSHVHPDPAHPAIEVKKEARVISPDSAHRIPSPSVICPPSDLRNSPSHSTFHLSQPPDRNRLPVHRLERIHPSIRHNFVWGAVLGYLGTSVRVVSADSDNLA
jgi:hypothetical protein